MTYPIFQHNYVRLSLEEDGNGLYTGHFTHGRKLQHVEITNSGLNMEAAFEALLNFIIEAIPAFREHISGTAEPQADGTYVPVVNLGGQAPNPAIQAVVGNLMNPAQHIGRYQAEPTREAALNIVLKKLADYLNTYHDSHP